MGVRKQVTISLADLAGITVPVLLIWGDKDVFRRIMESAGFVIGMLAKRKYLEIFMPYIAR